jgi:predicted peroxiredoxin
MTEKTDYSKKSFIVIGTHGEENAEKATMTFACAGASSALGIRTKVFLTGDGVKLAQKGFADKMPSVEGMAPLSDMMKAYLESGGEIEVCIPCLESRGIDKASFLDGVRFINLMDFAAEAVDTDRVLTC